jgi:hypothetical protein
VLNSLLVWAKKSKVRHPQQCYDSFVDGVLEAKKQVLDILRSTSRDGETQSAVIKALQRQVMEYAAQCVEATKQKDMWHQNCDYWMNEAKVAANGNTVKAEIRMERWKARAVWWMKKARDAEGDNEDLGVEVRRLRGVLDASE